MAGLARGHIIRASAFDDVQCIIPNPHLLHMILSISSTDWMDTEQSEDNLYNPLVLIAVLYPLNYRYLDERLLF